MREKISVSLRGIVKPSPVREDSFVIEAIDYTPGTIRYLYPDRKWNDIYEGPCMVHEIYPDPTHQFGFCVGEMIPYEMPAEEEVQKVLDRVAHAFPQFKFSIVHYHGTRYGDLAAIVVNQKELVQVIGTIPAKYNFGTPVEIRDPDEFDWTNLHCDEEIHNHAPQPSCGPLTSRLNEFHILSSPIYLPCWKKSNGEIALLNRYRNQYEFYEFMVDPTVSMPADCNGVFEVAAIRYLNSYQAAVSGQMRYQQSVTKSNIDPILEWYRNQLANRIPYAALADITANGKAYTAILQVYDEYDGSKSYDLAALYYELGDSVISPPNWEWPTGYDSMESFHYINIDESGIHLSDAPSKAAQALTSLVYCELRVLDDHVRCGDSTSYPEAIRRAIVLNAIRCEKVLKHILVITPYPSEMLQHLSEEDILACIDYINRVNSEANARIRNQIKKGKIKLAN